MPKTKIQQRWQTARDVAAALGIKTKDAWRLLKKLQYNELVDPILEGVPEALELGRDIADEECGKRPSSMQRNAGDVKLMLWAFDKIGDLERIKVAYRKALQVVE